MELFPRKDWGDVNATLVGFGQSICKAKRPLCGECPISRLCVAEENFTKKVTKETRKMQVGKEIEGSDGVHGEDQVPGGDQVHSDNQEESDSEGSEWEATGLQIEEESALESQSRVGGPGPGSASREG